MRQGKAYSVGVIFGTQLSLLFIAQVWAANEQREFRLAQADGNTFFGVLPQPPGCDPPKNISHAQYIQ